MTGRRDAQAMRTKHTRTIHFAITSITIILLHECSIIVDTFSGTICNRQIEPTNSVDNGDNFFHCYSLDVVYEISLPK